jgi:hypothetical protein
VRLLSERSLHQCVTHRRAVDHDCLFPQSTGRLEPQMQTRPHRAIAVCTRIDHRTHMSSLIRGDIRVSNHLQRVTPRERRLNERGRERITALEVSRASLVYTARRSTTGRWTSSFDRHRCDLATAHWIASTLPSCLLSIASAAHRAADQAQQFRVDDAPRRRGAGGTVSHAVRSCITAAEVARAVVVQELRRIRRVALVTAVSQRDAGCSARQIDPVDPRSASDAMAAKGV